MKRFIYMYIHIYTMAKTIMISNDVYEELKIKKEKRSFSGVITDLLHANKSKTGSNLRACLGLLRKDEEFKASEKARKEGWKAWNRRYV